MPARAPSAHLAVGRPRSCRKGRSGQLRPTHTGHVAAPPSRARRRTAAPGHPPGAAPAAAARAVVPAARTSWPPRAARLLPGRGPAARRGRRGSVRAGSRVVRRTAAVRRGSPPRRPPRPGVPGRRPGRPRRGPPRTFTDSGRSGGHRSGGRASCHGKAERACGPCRTWTAQVVVRARSRLAGQQRPATGLGEGRQPGVRAELAQQVLDVAPNRVLADEQPLRHGGGAQPRIHQGQHLELPRG